MVGRPDSVFVRLLVGVFDYIGDGIGCLLYARLLAAFVDAVTLLKSPFL